MILRRNRSDPPVLRMLFDAGTATGLTDGQLLERFATRGGDAAEPAFAALVDRHGPMVWRVCRSILGDDHEAEDAFQATFLILVRRAGSLWVRDSLGPWLHRVASHAAIRARVRASRRRAAEREATAMATRSRSAEVGEDLTGLIHAEIDRLPDRFRMPVVLCDVEGRTYEEAARHLRCPVGTIKSRLARGRERLRGRLARRGLAAAGLRPEAMPAAPTSLVQDTIRAAMAFAAGKGGVPASVASLSRGITRDMAVRGTRAPAIAGLLAVVGIVGAGLMVRAEVGPDPRPQDGRRPIAPEGSSSPPVGSLTGIVRDPDGRPVAGATVAAGPFDARNHASARTGPDGRFVLSPGGRSSKWMAVIAYKEGLAPDYAWDRDGLDGRAELELSLPGPVPFVGVVKDRQGRPVAGAAVRMRLVGFPGPDGSKPGMLLAADRCLPGTSLERAMRTTTDTQGRFQIREMPKGARAELVVSAAGFGEYDSINHPLPDGGFGRAGTAEAPAEVVLAPAARVVGRVATRFRSIRVGGLKVGLEGAGKTHSLWRETRTDAEGGFEFDSLDEGTANVFLKDHPNDGPWTYRAIDGVELQSGRTTEVRIELIRGVQVEGRVVDATVGAPVPGVGVAVGLYGPAGPRQGGGILTATTDEEGRYRFRVPPGMKDIYISKPPPTEDGGTFFGSQTVIIPEGERDFTVPPIVLQKAKPRR